MTTFVQQLDAQGPAVVQRIETHVGDLACSDDTVQQLVEALHSGKSVTITSNVNGQTKTSTFNASGTRLGYGEAYIALALAAQQLRNAGVTGCATPEQWQAVLLGGPLNVTNSSTTVNTSASASGSSTVPGIVTLHRQGQGWGQIAQTSNLQLGQVISSSDAPSPTGYSSAEMNSGKMNKTDDDTSKGEKKGWWQRFKDRDADDKKKDQDHEPKGHEQNPGNSESSPNR